jgi:hypothetical protein
MGSHTAQCVKSLFSYVRATLRIKRYQGFAYADAFVVLRGC